MKSLCTVAPALPTPFTSDGDIDWTSLEGIIEHTLSGGVDALVVLGTTGESATLTLGDRQQVFAFVAQCTAGRVPLIAGIGGNNTAEVVRLCCDFPCIDTYSAFLSVCPYYTKPSQAGIIEHYRAIASASPLPIILYNVPGRTGVNMSAETTATISHECPNVLGIKEAAGRVDQAREICERARPGFEVYSGDDMLSHEIIGVGGVGCIGVLPNAFPTEFVEYIHAALAGDQERIAVQYTFLKQFDAHLYTEGNPVGIKTLLSEMKLCEDFVRLPLVPGTAQLHAEFRKILEVAL